jgi:AcrR family transcriptional regulator
MMTTVPEWIPTESSSKGRLVLRAVEAFSAKPFEDVNVVALCAAANVTTGTLYHHFETKLGLYEVVRLEVERRTVDRIAGALAARGDDPPTAAVRAALLVGFDYVVSTGRARLVGAPVPAGREDLVETTLAAVLGSDGASARLWVAAWRAALMCTLDGFGVEAARAALAKLGLSNGE